MMETEFSVYDQTAANQPRLFKCKHCDFTNNEKKAVIGHLGVHAGLKPYRCKLCGMMSNWKHVIIRHVKLRHGGEMNFVEDRISYTQEGDTIKLSGVIVEGKSIPILQKSDMSSTVFPCSLCPYTCEKHYYMQFHMKQHQPRPDAEMKCPLCPYWVKFKKTLTRHMKLHELPSYIPYQTPDQAVVQNKENERNVNFSLEHDNRRKVQNSMQTEKPPKRKRHQCDFCPYATNNMTQFLYHKQFHRPNKNAPFKCNMCTYWSTHNHLIIQHTKIHNDTNTPGLMEHEPLDSKYSINYGGEFVKMNENPAKKMRLEAPVNEVPVMYSEPEPEYKYKCTICSYHCNDQRSLSTHYKFHQVVSTEIMAPEKDDENAKSPNKSRGFSYFCTKCPSMFKSRADYITHCNFHGAWLPFACPHCDYKAKHKPHLHKHLHVHSDEYVARREASSTPLSVGNQYDPPSVEEMPSINPIEEETETKKKSPEKLTSRLGVKQLKCTFCPAVFYKLQTFEYHVALHGGSGDHKCSMCTYAAMTAASLTKHLELHHKKITAERKSSVKIFNCPNCPAFFTKQARYDKHLSLHGQENKYTCEKCNYSVKFAANLIKHKSVHNNSPPTLSIQSPVKEVSIPMLPPPIIIPPVKAVTKVEVIKEVKEKNWFSCSRCPYSQTRKDALQTHQRRHDGIKDGIFCPHCDYCTLQTSFLRDHIKRHFQPMPYFKIQAYFKCGPMEIWAIDEEGRELIFKYAGEDSQAADRFYPACEQDQQDVEVDVVSISPDVPVVSETVDNQVKTGDVLQPAVLDPVLSQPAVEELVAILSEPEVEPPSAISNGTVKRNLIEDALRKTKKLEIILTDVFQERKNRLKAYASDGNFKIPDLGLIEIERSAGSIKTEVLKTTEVSPTNEMIKPSLDLPNAEVLEESKCEEEPSLVEGNVTGMLDLTPDYFEGVEEYMEHEEIQAEIESSPNHVEGLEWVEKPEEEAMLIDVMIGGDIYNTDDEPGNMEMVTVSQDMIEDRESDATTDESFLEVVSEETPNIVISESEPSSLPVEGIL